jgi:hypothetical protein
MKSPSPTEPYEFLTLFNCRINSITFNSGTIPKKDHTIAHLTTTTKGDKTIQTEILAHFWGKSAQLYKKGVCTILGRELSRKILLEQETKQIELININVTRYKMITL